MKTPCIIYLFSVILSVTSNPLRQQVQPCNVCQPMSYSNANSIPIVIQQPSNTHPYPQRQGPSEYPAPLEDNLNQIILNKFLSNPSLQKIINPNTKLYNQNGEEVQRQVPNTGVPNVINNYFIVPPDFFKLNGTMTRNEEEVNKDKVVRKSNRKKSHRRISKRRPKKVELSSNDDDDVVVTKTTEKTRKPNESGNVKRKRKRINIAEKNLDGNESQEVDRKREQEIAKNRRKQRIRNKNKNKHIETLPPIEESNEDDLQEKEKPMKLKKERKIEEPKNPEPKSNVIDKESHEIEPDNSKEKQVKDDGVVIKENVSESHQEKKNKKKQRKESSDISEGKILQNIEIPTDITNREPAENRQTRDSKRNAAKREPKQKLTPYPDDVMNNFFPNMPMNNFNNPNTNYPYNFDQYYQYFNPVRNSNAKKNKKRRKNQNRKKNEQDSNTHTIEIKLKPIKKENTTETPITTEKPKDVHEETISIKVDQSKELTDIPMQMAYRVSPVKEDENESRSKESYETFSKLEDMQEFLTPELGQEDEVLNMNNNGIINDYYPIFDDDVYYNPYVEKLKNIEDDRYFYETGKEEKQKYDRYEDSRSPNRDMGPRELENPGFQTKNIKQVGPDINKFDHNEYLDHIASFSDIATPEDDIIKARTGIRRVTVPPKNTRLKSDTVETVYAGSKVAIYGVPLDETEESNSSQITYSDENNSSNVHTTYVVAKSLGPPEDDW